MSKPSSDAERELVAAKFVAILKTWLTPAQFREAKRLNKAEGNPRVCHMHDFCDANMALLEAFETSGYTTDEVMDDEAMWSDIYDRAMPALGGKRVAVDRMDCAECGEPMFLDANGVSHHWGDGPENIDHDADLNHVAFKEE